MLAVVTGLAVGFMAYLTDTRPTGDVHYVVPHQYESQTTGPVVSGAVTGHRR